MRERPDKTTYAYAHKAYLDELALRIAAQMEVLRLGKVEAALRAIIADCAVGVGTARIIEVARAALKGPADAE